MVPRCFQGIPEPSPSPGNSFQTFFSEFPDSSLLTKLNPIVVEKVKRTDVVLGGLTVFQPQNKKGREKGRETKRE